MVAVTIQIVATLLLFECISHPITAERLTKRRHKREVLDHYHDDHCIQHFSLESRTIIRTKDSRENGAVFINETEVGSMTRCLQLCCATPLCNVAVYGEERSCYLFDCGSPEAFKCQFTGNDEFASAVLDIDRHKFDLSSADNQRDHSDQLEILRGGQDRQELDEPEVRIQDDCGRWQFSCNSGDCIAIYDVCNGIPQCRDASDEDPDFCKTQTTVLPPAAVQEATTRHLHIRPDMDPPSSGGTAFQHRGNGLQVQGGGGGGYQPQQSDYFYPQDGINQNLKPNVNFPLQNNIPYLGSPYMQQFQQQYSSQFAPQYGIPQQPYLPLQPLQPQQQQLIPQQPMQQLPRQTAAPPPPPPPPQPQQTTRKADVTTKRTTTTTTTIGTTTLSEMEKYEKNLIEELGEQLQPLEMPGVAMFTLVVGILLTTFILVVVICRIRRGRISFRRKLTHDADGDFLVNGMYL